jgi:dipeptidyl aminopeptidase/acylaminoacyl peptidase
MRTHCGRFLASVLVVAVAGCARAPKGMDTTTPSPTAASEPTASPTIQDIFDRKPTVRPGAILRTNGEVLSFTGDPSRQVPGDLVAVNPESGEERVLVEDLEGVYSARWSADGRWVAYETPAPEGVGLWVVSASHEPRQVATDASTWAWSSTGAELATIPFYSGATLSTIDPVTSRLRRRGHPTGRSSCSEREAARCTPSTPRAERTRSSCAFQASTSTRSMESSGRRTERASP